MSKLSVAERRRYIDEHLNYDWGWTDYVKGPTGYSYNDMLAALARKFGAGAVPSNAMTLKRDVDKLRDAAAQPDEQALTEAQLLLDPNRFPEWRAKFFRVPETGEPFQTPKFQHAIFWVMHAATFKVALPQWVIDLLDDLDPKHPFPENINDLITGKERMFLSFVLLMAPRHGKTELAVHFMLHTFALDPNKRIMFGNGTQKKSEGFIDNAVMSMMEGEDSLSEQFVEMFGPFKHDSRAWSKQGFVLAGRDHSTKSFSMQPFGIAGNIRSFDADAIIGDDLQSLQRARSETVTEDDYNWYTTELMLRREMHTSLINLGSHVAVQTGDLFTRIEANLDKLNTGKQRTILKKIPAHNYAKCNPTSDPDHKRCILWQDFPDRDYGFIEAQRAVLDDDAMFEAVYNQIPQTRKMQHFPPDILRAPYVHVEPNDDGTLPVPKAGPDTQFGILDYRRSFRERVTCCKRDTVLCFGFDPASSEKKGASFSALVALAGCLSCGRRYIVDYWKDRQSPEVNPDTIKSFVQSYPYVNVINIEINAYMKSLSRDPRMQRLEQQSRFVIKEWTTDERKHDPIMGIPAAARHVKAGMLSLPYQNSFDQEFAETMVKEFQRWPQKPNDLVMAFWLAELAVEELIEESRFVEAELMPGTEKWMTQWHEESVTEFDLSAIESPEWEYS